MLKDFKSKRAYNNLRTGKEVDFKGFSYNEILKILNLVEKDCVESLKEIDKLLQQKKSIENSLKTVRKAKLELKKEE